MLLCRPLVSTSLATLCGAALLLACAPARVAPTPAVVERMPPNTSSAAAAPEVDASAAAPAPDAPVTPTSEGLAPEASAPDEPAPPCIDGEILMGACICERGKSADPTGHCVLAPCPNSTAGGVPFRDEATGQCMECRAGTRPTKDGRCAP